MPWIILLACFISSPTLAVLLSAANFIAILLLPNLHSELTFAMMGLPIAFLFAMAIVIILGSILREMNLNKIVMQGSELILQKDELNLYISLLLQISETTWA